MRWAASEVAAAAGGTVAGPEVGLDGVAIDSRAEVAGRLFVPLVAARDGHDFIAAAVAAGAPAYLTARPPADVPATAIGVDDTAAALAALGVAARRRLPERVVGITGSVGKTSTKDLLAAALATRFRTAASERSFNNELGVPLTLANAADATEAVVLEMGARGIGHIAELCSVGRPTVGLVTVVGHVHTELFGTIDDVARGKGELVEALPAAGTAVLNAGDLRVAAMASRTRASVLRFAGPDAAAAEAGTADVTATEVRLDAELRPAFRLRSPWGDADVRLAVRGAHQVLNAVGAAAAALACGVDPDAVAAGLAGAALSPWRMELHRTPAGALVLNDAYNANPISVAAALRSLAALDATRRVAVLGTMAELGPYADEEHARAGALARRLGLELVTVGEPRYGGRDVADVEAARALVEPLDAGAAVLVKGSRVAGLERLAALFVAGDQPADTVGG